MSKKDDALKLALEALENNVGEYRVDGAKAIIREALAEQPAQQEPVAWMIWTHGPVLVFMNKDEASMEFDRLNHAYPAPTRMLVPLYTSPQPSKPHGFAGVTAWIGDATVTRIVTQVQIQHERVAGQSMKQTAQVCLDMLAAHGITGEK